MLAAARNKSCALIVKRMQTKLPYPLEAAILVAQRERAKRFQNSDGQLCAGPPPADLVTYGEVLKLGEDAGRTWAIEKAKEPVEPVVAIQPATLVADLHQPRPDVLWRRIHGDRLHRHLRRIGDQRVAGHHARKLLRRGSPPAEPSPNRKPVDRCEREDAGEFRKAPLLSKIVQRHPGLPRSVGTRLARTISSYIRSEAHRACGIPALRCRRVAGGSLYLRPPRRGPALYATLVRTHETPDNACDASFFTAVCQWGASDRAISEARQRVLAANGGVPPKVLDQFAGGGAIPLAG